MPRAYVGIGANLGDARTHVLQAIHALGEIEQTTLLRASSLYRTAPVGFLEQPDFINAVASIDTHLDAHRLLAKLRDIECRHGRVRAFKDAPRTLDLDLLLYDDVQFTDETLAIPHPRMHERAFVLAPLAEIATDVLIPGKGSVSALLAACADQKIEKL
ncbi:MAG TPA: 2-amino-4-hydroxy-6-hydroxymethyldihydropteridine diphosphokinase [Burkholderiales bacterium]|nr:2-amino-4-hydroxy-6-hydroxymethyldihydropteridine diphosphokinase [Burkholderiales bacterium]